MCKEVTVRVAQAIRDLNRLDQSHDARQLPLRLQYIRLRVVEQLLQVTGHCRGKSCEEPCFTLCRDEQ